jgi:hypothetical protein
MSLMTALAPERFGASRPPVRAQTRQARLRQEYAPLYPGLRPGEWMAAAIIADRLLADSLLRGSGTAIRGRVLQEAHFEFQGGTSRGGERDGMRLRREDAG